VLLKVSLPAVSAHRTRSEVRRHRVERSGLRDFPRSFGRNLTRDSYTRIRGKTKRPAPLFRRAESTLRAAEQRRCPPPFHERPVVAGMSRIIRVPGISCTRPVDFKFEISNLRSGESAQNIWNAYKTRWPLRKGRGAWARTHSWIGRQPAGADLPHGALGRPGRRRIRCARDVSPPRRPARPWMFPRTARLTSPSWRAP
jgi:hypothetical protein